MSKRTAAISAFIVAVACAAYGQESHEYTRMNFNVGGGIGFPVSDTSNFVDHGANFVVGAGPNLNRIVGIDGEFMWHDLPIKRSVIRQLGVPNASARNYSLTANLILRVPTHGAIGAYVIGGGGWYRRTEEATAPALVPGTVCPAFWNWWGACVNGLFPTNLVIASRTSDAFGGNGGGGITFRFAENVKFYAEVRYHHASHNRVTTDIVPLTFGLRW